ncbi:MAG: PHP domain-containing protein [Clostridiales bacterium]|nr:PHP domain-containing protein [Clostridiales bacterium]
MAEKTYRYDLHVHTYEGSACARSTGAEMADFYKSLGYAGIVITDHFWAGNTRVDRNQPWEDWLAGFKEGYLAAKRRGDEIGLDVFYGWEYSFYGTDYLTYGLDNDWAALHPEIKSTDIVDYLNLVRSSGGYVIHAHPFMEAHYIPYIRLLPRHVDAVEVINAPKPQAMNDRAMEYARGYDLTMTAGSDCHSVDAKHLAGIEVDRRLTSIFDLIDALKNREHRLFRIERE